HDRTRETGGTLGVAIIGSVFVSGYASHLSNSRVARLPGEALHEARRSIGAGLQVVAHTPDILRPSIAHDVTQAFMSGLHAGCLVAAGAAPARGIGATALPG